MLSGRWPFGRKQLSAELPIFFDPPPSSDDLWKNYQLHIDLYKHYLTSLIQLNTFSFSASGAVIVYSLTHLENSSLTKWALLLPFGLGVFLGVFLIYAYSLAPNTDALVKKINERLRFNVYPATHLLKALLLTFGVLHIFIGVAAAILFITLCRNQQ